MNETMKRIRAVPWARVAVAWLGVGLIDAYENVVFHFNSFFGRDFFHAPENK
jgi:hypothetical protein